jgi:hypothetical protein
MKVAIACLVVLMGASAAFGIPYMQANTAQRAEAEARAATARAADPSLNLYHQLVTLRTSMLPTWKDAESYTKNSEVQRQDIFRKLWNFRVSASQLNVNAHADGINPDVRQAAESTWQELDEAVQGLTAADVALLSTGEFGKGLGSYQAGVAFRSVDEVTEHLGNFARLNTTALDALDSYEAAYTADHGVAPSV